MANKPVKARRVRIPKSNGSSRSVNAASKLAVVSRTSRKKVAGLAKLKPKNIWKWANTAKGRATIIGSAAIGLGLIVGVFLWYSKDLPSPNKINNIVNASTTKLYANDGTTVLAELYGDKNRSLISFDQMPKDVKNATVAIEDKNFYKHGAFSVFGIARAFYYTVFKRDTQGGSTITQQYVKNALLTDQRSIGRKIKELILSIEIEQTYKKDDILKLYLNEIPYGSTAYGIQAAAKTYFGKDAKDLTLEQSAMLAALPQAPSYYSPYGTHRDILIARQHSVLDAMAEQHYITKDQAAAAKKVDVLAELVPYRPDANEIAPHFVQYVRTQLENQFGIKGVNEGGLKVITTLDISKQHIAEDAVAKGMAAVRYSHGSNAALVSEDPTTGEVQAMVGSYDYNDPTFGNYNAADAPRQPGSSFKPFVYSTLFKGNYGPGTTLYDVSTDFGNGYRPPNYTGLNYGVVSIRQALSGSLNIPAVKSLYLAGVSNSIATAKSMGITTLDPNADYGLTLVLGTGEVKLVDMVNAYGTFATGGVHHNQVVVRKVTDSTGKVLINNKPENNRGKQVLDPQIAFLIAHIISDNGARCSLGTFPCNNPLTLPDRPVATKTGTTNDFKDAWTMGFTPSVVTGVWAGNNDNTPMTQASSIVAAPIWQTYMKAVTKGTPVEQFKRPSGIKEVTLDANTGKAPTPGTKKTRTDIFPSWYQIPQASSDQTAKIDKVSGKLATDCTPPDAIDTITAGSIVAEVPPTDPSYSRWEAPVAALAAKLGDSGSSIPTQKDDVHSCDDAKPAVSLSSNHASGSSFTLTAAVTSGRYTANRLIVYRDGNVISDQNISGSGSYDISDTPTSTGAHSYSAKVFDAGLYTTTSNTVNVTATTASAPSVGLNCSVGTTKCTVTVIGGNGTIFVNVKYDGTSQGNKSGAITIWSGWNASYSHANATVTDSSGTYTATYP